MENTVSITNISSGNVIINCPEIKLRRELVPGRTIKVSNEDYQELTFDNGFNAIVRGGFIRVNGVPEEERPEQSREAYSRSELEKIMLNKDFTTFARIIPQATAAEKDSILQIAIENNLIDGAYTSLIKKYLGVDVVQAINLRHQAEE